MPQPRPVGSRKASRGAPKDLEALAELEALREESGQ